MGNRQTTTNKNLQEKLLDTSDRTQNTKPADEKYVETPHVAKTVIIDDVIDFGNYTTVYYSIGGEMHTAEILRNPTRFIDKTNMVVYTNKPSLGTRIGSLWKWYDNSNL